MKVEITRKRVDPNDVTEAYAKMLKDGFEVKHVIAVPEAGLCTYIMLIGVKVNDEE